MEFSVSNSGNSRVVAIRGRMTFQEQRSFRALIEDVYAQPASQYVFDLQQVDYVDSSGLGMLLIARKRAQQGNAKVVLRNIPDSAKETFATARFEELFDIQA